MGISARLGRKLLAAAGVDLPKSALQSKETHRRLAMEESNTRELLFQLENGHHITAPRSKFHPDGQFRVEGFAFDLAWPDERFLVELQGLKGHTRIASYIDDCRKAGVAVAAGFVVLPVVSPHIKTGEAARWIAGHLTRALKY